MRIGIEVSLLFKERSGIGQYIRHLIDGLGTIDSKNEYVLFYASLKHPANHVPALPYSNISLTRFRWPKWSLHLASGVGRWRISAFERFLDAVDILHWPNSLLVPRRNGKQIITINDLTFKLFPSYHPWIRAKGFTSGINRSAQKADAVIVPSEHTKRDVVALLGTPESRVRVIYDAASPQFRPTDIQKRRAVLEKYHLSSGSYLLFVGNIEPRKNLVRLLEAYRYLQQQWRYPQFLVLVGGRGWRNHEVYRKVEDLALSKEVKFLGYVPDRDLPYLMNGASLFVYPSLYEGFGLPPLEAMACGTPVVTSNTSSLPEILGDASIMVDPYDIEGLAQAMHRVLADKALAEEMRRRGQERAKLFSWEDTARKTLKVYEEVYSQGDA